ncbi:MAG: large conductance mechanosensitive channel protein MscL [Oscillospiraceae bacterium]|nr:large conductance mechanosensitive channel protein MscL [Oscillospiraceae bacterium]MDD4367509.1 large conductance mechanosensitive channel protein MscL [Oscillospiraceae bacterium]
MSWVKEFKEFIMRGNVIDMAVGVVVGSAFSAVVNSLVSDIIMPVIGFATAGIQFSDLKVMLGDASINYGVFIETIIKFLIIALCIFFVIKGINTMRDKLDARHKKAEEAAAQEPAAPTEAELLASILAELKAKK